MCSLVYLYRACAIANRGDVKTLLTELVSKSNHNSFYLTIKWNEIENRNIEAKLFIKILPLTVNMEPIKVEYQSRGKTNVAPTVTLTVSKDDINNMKNKTDESLLANMPLPPCFEEYIHVIAADPVLHSPDQPLTEQRLEMIFTDPLLLSILANSLCKRGYGLDIVIHGLKIIGLDRSFYTGKVCEVAKILSNKRDEIASENIKNELSFVYNGDIVSYINKFSECCVFVYNEKISLEVSCIPDKVGFSELIEKRYIIKPLCVVKRDDKKNYIILFKDKKYIIDSDIEKEIWANANFSTPPKYFLTRVKIFESKNLAEDVARILSKNVNHNIRLNFDTT